MPKLYKQAGSPNWYFSVNVGGKRLRPTTGTADKKSAQEYADTFAARAWRGEKLGEKHITFAAACVKWLKEEQRGKTDLCILRYLRKHIGDNTDIRSITAELARLEDKSPPSRRRYLGILNSICRLSGYDPKIKLPSSNQGRLRWLSAKEWKRLEASLLTYSPHLAPIARFAILTGLRMSNILSLEWSQCNLAQSKLWIHADQSKNGKPISVPLSNAALQVLKQQRGLHDKWCFPYYDRAPIKRVSGTGWNAAKKAAGLEDITFHDLRRTWASWHLMSGTPMQVLVKLGGWANSVIVEKHYGHLAKDHVARFAGNAKPK